ncbi:MAG: YceD family protein [Pseudomonadota bacterium]
MSGRLAAEQLERIREFSVGTTDGIDVSLSFRRDEEGRNRISGTVDTILHTRCERCLEPLVLPVHGDVDLLVIAAGADVPESAGDLNIVEIEDERLTLAGLVEEEVLLAVPQFPVHEACDMVAYDREAGSSTAQPAAKANPFDVLAALKRKD